MIRNAFRSGGFWVAFTVCFLSFAGLSFPEWLGSRDWDVQGQNSALQLSIMPVFFGGVSLLFPFCACTAYAPGQVEEIRSGMIKLKLIRAGLFRYIFGQIVCCMTVSAVAAGLAFFTHAGICHILALSSMPEAYLNHEIPFSPDCVYYDWYPVLHGIPILLWMGLAMAFTAGIWSVSGLAAAVWIPDKWLTVSLPVFLYFVLNSRTVYILTGVMIPYAADLYNDALTPDIIRDSLICDGVLLAIFALIYALGVERRATRD